MKLNLNYGIQMILAIVCIAIVILFYIRKRRVGVIVAKASLARIRFFYLIMGLFVLVTAFIGLYHVISFKREISDIDLYIFINGLTIAVLFIIQFLTLKIHIGLKGISVAVIPFFIPRDQIIDYQIFANTLVLKRKEENDLKIEIETNDVKNVESAIIQLQNNKF